MSYNYILNPIIRKRLNKAIHENSIIILDEAHNICNVFENLYSNKVKKKDLEKIKILLQIILDYININKAQIYKSIDEINPLFYLEEKEINEQINILNDFINNLDFLEPEKDKLCQKIDDYINKNCYLCKIEYFRNIFNKFSFDFYKGLDNAINNLGNKGEKDIKSYYNDNINSYFQVNIKEYNEKIKFKSILKTPKKLYYFLDRLKNLNKEEEISFKLFSQMKKKILNMIKKIKKVYFLKFIV